MAISYKSARRIGSGIILLIIIGIGLIPSLMLMRFSGPGAELSVELTELENMVALHDLFQVSERLFKEHAKGGEVNTEKIVQSLNEAIRILDATYTLTEGEGKQYEKQTILRLIANTRRFKAAVVAYIGEAEHDPTSDNREELEKRAVAALADVNDAVLYYMRDIDDDIRNANEGMKNVLGDGRMMSLIGLAVGVIGGLLAILLIDGILNRRLLKVVDGTRIIARGDMSHRIRVESDDEIGRLAYFFNTMTADLQKREEELKAGRNLYQTLVDNIGLGITLIDGEYNILMINAARREIAGKPRERMVGEKCFKEFRERDDVCADCPGRRAMAAGRPEQVEMKGNREDGSEIRMTVKAFPVRGLDGEIEGFVEVVEDVTDQKRAEEAFLKSEEKHRSILEDMGDGYFEVDLAGSFTFANRAIRELVQFTREEMDGLNYKEFVDERDQDRVFEMYNQVFATGRPKKAVEYRIMAKNGDVKTIETSIYPVTESEGETIGFRGVFRDVTKKRELETNLQRAEKMEAIGTLAGGVAHDLNNILSGIVSYPELLLLDLSEESPLRKPILTIKKSGEKAAAIVQDLLTLARRGVAVKETTRLNDIVSEYLKSPEFGRLQSFHPDVRFETALDPTLFYISGSPVHLSKTVMNLASNAAEAISGEGTVTITTENRYIESREGLPGELEEGDYVILKVRDDGAGISEEDQGKIFEPFYTKKTMGRSGTGLGMAVVWGTVKDHGGYIDLRSNEGEGAVFTIYFPATREAETAAVRTGPTMAEYKGRGESVLIVDDSPEQREIASGMLKRLGYAATTAASGEEAVDYVKEHAVDLLVLDMIMDPGIDGLETYTRIIESRPGQKAIIASGFSETERVKEAERLGAGGYIKKPYTLEQIGMAVRNELGRGGVNDSRVVFAMGDST